MKPPPLTHWLSRWLGIDAALLAVFAVHLAVRAAAIELILAEWFSHPALEYVWMFAIGLGGCGAVLLALWLAWGEGRPAVRAVWAAGLAFFSWRLAMRFGWRDDEPQLVAAVGAGVELLALVWVVALAALVRLASGARLVRDASRPLDSPGTAGRWQFRLADLFLWPLTVSLVVLSREWLIDASTMFYVMGTGLESHIYYAIRCGAALCAAIGSAGVVLLLRDRPRIALFLGLSAVAMAAAIFAARGPFATPLVADLVPCVQIYGSVGLGCLLATLATLVPLRRSGWRCRRDIRPAANLPAQVTPPDRSIVRSDASSGV
jgi:hypothetical protein